MDTWTIQKGYPVVSISRVNRYRLVLTQKWFLLNPTRSFKSSDEYRRMKWFIPFTFTTKSQLDFNCEKSPYWFQPDQNECKY